MNIFNESNFLNDILKIGHINLDYKKESIDLNRNQNNSKNDDNNNDKNEKVALCFIISYSQSLNKEKIWIEWIEPNKDIINIYFHYKNFSSIKSEFIKKFL